MASRLSLIILFLHLLILQEMMMTFGEAAMCEAPSELFKGVCLRSSNCGTICDKEGFLNGRCKFFKCICSKDCGSPSGGGDGDGGDGGDGGDNPPADGDGGDNPPAGGDGGDGGDGGEGGGEGGDGGEGGGEGGDGGDSPPAE